MNIIQRFKHILPKILQHSQHPNNQKTFYTKKKHALEPKTSIKLNDDVSKCVQSMKGTLSYYTRDNDNKLLVALEEIAT